MGKNMVRCHRRAFAARRGIAIVVRWVLVVAALGHLSSAIAQQACPNSDPNQDYNCPIGPVYTLPAWGNIPWSLPQYYSDILVGDIDGDGKAEVLGRDARGVHVWSFNSTLGTWQPVLDVNAHQELILPLSDAQGWSSVQYYTTLALADIEGKPGKQLIARSSQGLVVYQFVKGSIADNPFPAGSWHQLTSSGPFADTACFGNGKCWNASPYYTTIRFADVDGHAGAEAIGWGGDGIESWKWNGSGWTQLAGIPLFGDAADNPAAPFLVVADVANAGRAQVVDWNPDGVFAYAFSPSTSGGSWSVFAPQQQFFSNPGCDNCFMTFKTAVLDRQGATLIGRFEGCAAEGGGIFGARIVNGAWTVVFNQGPFDDCSGFANQANWGTIQYADIDGDGIDEAVGRGPGGILAYHWSGSGWTPLVTNSPALSDALWATDASYWSTLKTADVTGLGRASLIARGQAGLRTWTYQAGAFTRVAPYGNFPPFVSQGESGAYGALNTQFGFDIRSLYTDQASDQTASNLRSVISDMIHIGKGCSNELSVNPPQYVSCDPLAGATNPTYTVVVNQLIKELFWAASVLDHFTLLDTMQNELFTTDGMSLPAIDTNLQLAQASAATGRVDYVTLFANILQVAGALTEQPEISVAADLLSTVDSVLPAFQNPATAKSKLAQTYSQMLAQVVSLNEQEQTVSVAQKHHIMADYGLLSTVGPLISRQYWTLDTAGYLSVNRQAFVKWVYQGLLPTVWEYLEFQNCRNFSIPPSGFQCTPPADAANFGVYQNNGVDFSALVPFQTPCNWQPNFPHGTFNWCTFKMPEQATVDFLFTPVSAQCTYAPGTGNAWVYPGTSSGGCTLGVGAEIFNNQGGWNFQADQIAFGSNSMNVNSASAVTSLHDPATPPRVHIQGLALIGDDVDLDLTTARFAVRRVLGEAAGEGELVKDVLGNAFTPVALLPQPAASPTLAVFRSAAASTPRITAQLQLKPHRALSVDVTVDGAAIVDPLQCFGVPAKTRLHVEFVLSGGGLAGPMTLAQVNDWTCQYDGQGVLRGLQSAARPAFNVLLVAPQ
jgi:hypothetical protein